MKSKNTINKKINKRVISKSSSFLSSSPSRTGVISYSYSFPPLLASTYYNNIYSTCPHILINNLSSTFLQQYNGLPGFGGFSPFSVSDRTLALNATNERGQIQEAWMTSLRCRRDGRPSQIVMETISTGKPQEEISVPFTRPARLSKVPHQVWPPTRYSGLGLYHLVPVPQPPRFSQSRFLNLRGHLPPTWQTASAHRRNFLLPQYRLGFKLTSVGQPESRECLSHHSGSPAGQWWTCLYQYSRKWVKSLVNSFTQEILNKVQLLVLKRRCSVQQKKLCSFK